MQIKKKKKRIHFSPIDIYLSSVGTVSAPFFQFCLAHIMIWHPTMYKKSSWHKKYAASEKEEEKTKYRMSSELRLLQEKLGIWQQMKSTEQYDDFWLHFHSDLFFLVQMPYCQNFILLFCLFFHFLLIQSQFNKMNYPYHRRKSFYYLILKHLLAIPFKLIE